jgi:hypothetical protein
LIDILSAGAALRSDTGFAIIHFYLLIYNFH